MAANNNNTCHFPYKDVVVMLNECGTDAYGRIYQDPFLKVCYFAAFLVSVVVGGALLAGIIYFEMNVCDPMKRGIINKCVLALCWCHLVNSVVCNSMKLKRCLWGPLSHHAALFLIHFGIFNFEAELNLLMAILSLRCIMLHKNVAVLRFEDFWFVYLLVLNFTMTSLHCVVGLMFFKPNHFYGHQVGALLVGADDSKGWLHALLAFDFVAYLLLTAFIFKKRRCSEEDDALIMGATVNINGRQTRINTSVTNKSLMQLGHSLVNLVLFVLSSVPPLMAHFQLPGTNDPAAFYVILNDLLPPFIYNFVFPFTFYLQHRNLIPFYSAAFRRYFFSWS